MQTNPNKNNFDTCVKSTNKTFRITFGTSIINVFVNKLKCELQLYIS